LVVEFADVRILAFGTLNKPRSLFYVNNNAHVFLHPPGIDMHDTIVDQRKASGYVTSIYVDSSILSNLVPASFFKGLPDVHPFKSPVHFSFTRKLPILYTWGRG
jgi:hypothetical protein